MPDNNNISDLMDQLREQLELIKKPGGVPVHRNVEAALNLVATVVEKIDETNNDQEQDLTEIQEALAQLEAALQANTDADAADRLILNDLVSRVAALEQRVSEIPAEVDQKIAGALAPVNTKIDGIDQRETNRHQEVLDKIAELEAKIIAGGITAEEAQALIDASLAPIKTDIQALKDTDVDFDKRIKAILLELERLEALIGTKITATQAQSLIDAATAPLIQKDLIHDEGIASLGTRVKTLEDKPAGISEARAREIAREELAPLKTDLQTLLDQNLDNRIKDLLTRVEALEKQPPGGGISEAEARRIIGEEIQKLRIELTALISQKAD
ncbi:MAG: hypothetical protein L6Q97_12960, partial [Thermoanaerobaculia bacterium]|nr:hypothetical protein [Thermoanaerobaculia bacterium]